MDPPQLGDMEHIQVRRQLRQLPVRKDHLELQDVVLKVGEGALQQHLSVGEDAHMVAHILQLPQVVGGDQHGGPPLGHISHEEGPHLPPHHRIQAVHRLIQHQDVRHTAQG